MKTAESYMPLTGEAGEISGIAWRDEALKAINNARKDVIKECAKKAKIIEHGSGICQLHCSVDKESILSLIKEIK